MANVNIRLINPQITFMQHMDDLEYAFLAGVGTGKSFVAALWVFNRAYIMNEKIFVGSQTWSTTEGVQFKALLDLFDLVGLKEDEDYSINKAKLEITFVGRKGLIKGCCSAAKKSIEGYTKFNGAWFDEAYNWDLEVLNYVKGRCRNTVDENGNLTDARYRYTGTPPLEPSGWYYEWLVKHPTMYVIGSTEDSIGKYNAPSYLEQQIEAWGGKDSPLTRIMVYGQLPDSNSTLSIFSREHHAVKIPACVGIDCSGGNNGDEAYFTVTDGINILEEYTMKKFTQKELLDSALLLCSKWNANEARVDTTGGYGTYLCEALSDHGIDCEGVNFGRKAYDSESYVNARAEMYVNLASRWNDSWGDIYKTERNATVLKNNSSGRLQLVEKEQIKKIIGHSPDGLDSLALALYTRELSKEKPVNADFVMDNWGGI